MAEKVQAVACRIGVIGLLTCWLISMSGSRGFGDILFRDTFEDVPTWESWTEEYGVSGLVERDPESDSTFQTQAHGGLSYHIYDPDSASYANARHVVDTISGNECMVEFYFWLDSAATYSADRLYLYKPTRTGDSADIEIVLDSVSDVTSDSCKWRLTINDADSSHALNIYLPFEQWHRFQIHHHPDWESGTGFPHHVDLYINGDSINSYAPLSGIYHPDTILFGTIDTLQNGEGFWDDVIITTPPTGDHPRLLFSQDYIDTLRDRSGDGTTDTRMGVTYKQLWESFEERTLAYIEEDGFWAPWEDPDSIWMAVPYAQPSYRHSGEINYWLRIAREIEKELTTVAFASVVGDSAQYFERAKEIVLSLSNWSQWTDPDLKMWHSYYSQLDMSHITDATALAYDMIFDSLASYERMSVQNSLLSLGIGQLFLNALEGLGFGYDPTDSPNGYPTANGAMGLAALVIDGDEEAYPEGTHPLDTARARIDTLHNTYHMICDRAGGNVEGQGYGILGTTYALLFIEADRQCSTGYDPYTDYLGEYPYSRLYGLVPGGTTEILFCDSWNPVARDPVFRLASHYRNGYAQWFLKDVGDWQDKYGTDIRFAPFLWLDATLDTLRPDDPDSSLPLGRHFPDIGWAVLRTGWEASDYTIALKSSFYGGGHCHEDQNHFVFGGDSIWMINDRGYKKKPAYHHNVILVSARDSVLDNLTLLHHFMDSGFCSCARLTHFAVL